MKGEKEMNKSALKLANMLMEVGIPFEYYPIRYNYKDENGEMKIGSEYGISIPDFILGEKQPLYTYYTVNNETKFVDPNNLSNTYENSNHIDVDEIFEHIKGIFDNCSYIDNQYNALEYLFEKDRKKKLVIYENEEVNYLPADAEKLYHRSMEKHPERAEQITIDFCNMMLRNDKFTAEDVERAFKEAGVTKKYFIDENGLHIM